jgi:hypothetical protein
VLATADDPEVTEESTRIAYVRALDAHRRAIATHEAAAVTLDPSIDRAALVGRLEATADYQLEANASKLYVRADEDRLADVRDRIGPTANAENPEEVAVSRPSDALEAKAAADGAFTTLLLGLGAVALLVGGVGIANVMEISVLERRSEIGLRRAVGATRPHVSTQFLTEALLLAASRRRRRGRLGAIATAAWAIAQGQPVVISPEAILGGLLASLLIGTIAGLYAATRASRLSPTEALPHHMTPPGPSTVDDEAARSWRPPVSARSSRRNAPPPDARWGRPTEARSAGPVASGA